MSEFETLKLRDFLPNTRDNIEQKQRCKRNFIESFSQYFQNNYYGPNKSSFKYELRQNILNIPSFGSLSCYKFSLKSAYYDKRPQTIQKCIRIRSCSRYHMFDLDKVFQELMNNNGEFKCPVNDCSGILRQSTDIIPDYLSYLYYEVTQGTTIDIHLNKQDQQSISEQYKTQIIQSQNMTLINGDKTIVTFQFDNASNTFKNILNLIENSMIGGVTKVYEKIKYEHNKKNLRTSFLDRTNNKFDNIGTAELNIISLLSGKRIRSGVIHQDCKHLELYIFDVEELILSLFGYVKSDKIKVQPSAKQIQCIYCNNNFTKQNILEKAIFFNRIRDIVSKQPFYSGKIYFQNNERHFKRQQGIIKAHQRLKDKYPNKQLNNIFKQMVSKCVGFWNGQSKQKFQKYQNQTINKNQSSLQVPFKKTIDYSKMFYPVRCKNCSSMNFVDLWQEMIHFVELNQLQIQDDTKCLSCKQRQFDCDQFTLYDQIYLDIQVLRLMQYNIVHIAFYLKEKMAPRY